MTSIQTWELIGVVVVALIVCFSCWYGSGWQEGYDAGWLDATHNWTDPK